MAKFFKNSKHILAFAVVFAVLAMSLFTGSVNIDADAKCAGRIEYWNGSSDNSLAGSGTQSDPYLITNAQELHYVCVDAGDAATVGKYYKVDPTIKAFILQSSATVTALGGDNAFMNISSGNDIKNLFEARATSANVTLLNWMVVAQTKIFDGNFDGSGVRIYGLYCDGPKAAVESVGLFPVIDGGGSADMSVAVDPVGVTIKNFAIKGAYYKTYRRVGGIMGAAWYPAGGRHVDGVVNIENCEVSNSFFVGQDLIERSNTISSVNSGYEVAEMGIVCGHIAHDPARLSKCLVYGNVGEYRDYDDVNKTTYVVDATKNLNVIFRANGVKIAGETYGSLSDSIVLGTQVNELASSSYCSNVYSDVDTPISTVTVLDSTDSAYGDDGQKLMDKLDWNNVWFMSETGPELRALHGEIRFVRAHSAHYYECADCGLKSAGGAVAHTWNVDTCTVCGYVCRHNQAGDQVIEDRDATCVEPQGTYTYCTNCDWISVDSHGSVSGHKLEWVDEIPADCHNTGVKGYWHCTVCGGNYLGETEEIAKWATMESSIAHPETELVTPITPHSAVDRENGEIIIRSDETGHWYVCYTCDGKLMAEESDELAEEGEVLKHKFVDGICSECGWTCPEHHFEPTGEVAVAGSCTVDREEELKCTICGKKSSIVIPAKHSVAWVDEVSATDRLEGRKAHYECSVCHEIYADAEGQTKITEASLVIPKTLPDGYQNVTINGGGNNNINTDNGNKSPATSDNTALIVSIAAAFICSASAVVIAKKKKS